ncbi:uncharacterized protein LOC126883909 [Diabrotica virgifera virgifera]|uniref:Uncharacterized protein n=1 Tax=Diabrotica virgifera virgifera TaxID=50390 RepID=A0ABM5K5W2_DIAVI|nr:uncharacterized protein LOC126883909 [Diabrotica virgifera virgifera]
MQTKVTIAQEDFLSNSMPPLVTNLDFNFIVTILEDAVKKASHTSERELYTRKGELRKRRKFEEMPSERQVKKIKIYIDNHNVKEVCKCPMNCHRKISKTRRESINKQYWTLSKDQQRLFIFKCTKKFPKRRDTLKTGNSKRTNTFKYFLLVEEGLEVNVCKVFLLATLGFDKNNDSVLKNIRVCVKH